MTAVPEQYHDLFERETFAHFATLMPDGMPHVSAVWIDYDAEADRVLVNTATGRQKHVNVQNDLRVGLSLLDPDDPYRALSLLGTVEETTEEGATEHIDALARRYTEHDQYQGDRSNRILFRIRVDRVLGG